MPTAAEARDMIVTQIVSGADNSIPPSKLRQVLLAMFDSLSFLEGPGFTFLWSTNTAASDPGSTYIKGNNAALGSITTLYVSETALEGGVGGYLSAVFSGSSAAKAVVIITDSSDHDNFVAATVTAHADSGTYRTLTVTVTSTGGSFAADATLVVQIIPVGDQGTPGDVAGPASSVDGEIALFSGTTGKVIQRATTTGLLKATSGVLAASTEITLSSGKVGIGPTTPEAKLHVQDTAIYNPQVRAEHVGATAGSAAYFGFDRARGTPSSRSAIQNGDAVGTLLVRGHDGASYINSAYIHWRVDGAVSTGIVPASIDFMTMSAAGSTASRLTIDADGYVGVGGVTSPSANLHTSGTVRFASIVSGLLKADASGNVSAEAAASASEVRTGTTTKYVNVANAYSAVDLVTLTDAATISVDMSTFINATVTLAGNRTLGSPTNEKVGQSGVIYIVQDATGSRTLAYGSDWKFAGGTAPTLTTTANAVDALFYTVRANNFIVANLVQDVK